MTTSSNGWPASPALVTRTIAVAGASFRVADNRDVETVFTYIAERYDATVQPLLPAQCGGFNYRPNVNDPSKLSNHSSGTAVDINWEQHPNARPTLSTYTRAQVTACHAILASIPELSEVVHWGGDWTSPLTTDAMHWELHDHDLPKLARVAERIREDDMALSDDDKAWIRSQIEAVAELVWAAPIGKDKTEAREVLGRVKTWLGRQK